MYHNNTLEIVNANNRIKAIEKLNIQFLQHVTNHARPEGLPAIIIVIDQEIIVTCFGQSVKANSRIIRDEAGLFAVEYLFYACQGENKQELWRFYLNHDGQLVKSLGPESHICDVDNRFVAKYICKPVMLAVLTSILFKPTES